MRFLRVTYLWVLLLPYAFWFAGCASNQLVLIANGDRFPVLANARVIAQHDVDSAGFLDDLHVVMTPRTHLNFLADIFDLGGDYTSVGDLLLYAGEWLSPFTFVVWLTLVIKKLNHSGVC